jgi:hypothetical protein
VNALTGGHEGRQRDASLAAFLYFDERKTETGKRKDRIATGRKEWANMMKA